MMSKLTRLRDEATRLLSVYQEYNGSMDDDIRRQAHVALDRFLMENREAATILMIDGLNREIDALRVAAKSAAAPPKKTLFSRLFKRNVTTDLDM